MVNGGDILCIGAALWDVIGRSPHALPLGADVGGRITRRPGGVALNIALALADAGRRPVLLTAIGRDPAGDALLHQAAARGVITAHAHRCDGWPTDSYMAIEGAGTLAAAIADVRTLEAAGAAILAPLDGGAPWAGMVALDGNLTDAALAALAGHPALAVADLRVAPASPGKGARLRPLLARPGTTFYVNLAEAGLLCDARFDTTRAAAAALVAQGARRAVVTDGAHGTTDADARDTLTQTPPRVAIAGVTGAGDTLMAAHMAAEAGGMPRPAALCHALVTAAAHVAGGTQ